ncbi:efflux RND transporter periplasmic adaptor subunit [Stenotrophomonas sp. GZD-301]|uniref:efflux RND transporter periplasmic adaptor subunit n=1 Tax=Stenotrophomonas sp. GZD-301 TaxID=3404814 RepID=UPI003BB7C72B
MSAALTGYRVRRRTLWAIGCLVVVVLLALFFFDAHRKRTAAAAALDAGAPAAVPVVVVAARRERLPEQVEAIGTVVADQQVLVASEVAGRVTAIHFASGQAVRAGTALVQLNDAPMRRELDRHRATAVLAGSSLERARRLQGQILSRAEFERHQATHDEARAQVAQMQEEIAQRRVRAPFDGVLGVRRINLGQYVDAGTPIVTLTDPSRLHVDFSVPERHLAVLGIGLDVSLVPDGTVGGRRTGTITAIDPRVDDVDRMVKVRATLDAAAHTPLWPGTFARVHVQLPEREAALTVPAVAVATALSGESLYVVRRGEGGAHAALVPVRTGTRHGDRVALEGEAIKAGDLVVVAGQINLRDGAAVTPRTQTSPAAVPAVVAAAARAD